MRRIKGIFISINSKNDRRRRILFVSESVTLAHFARPVALAQTLDSEVYDVYIASDPRYLRLISNASSFSFLTIHSIPSFQFNRALAKGKPLYDTRTLQAYVKEDLSILEDLKPDLVIGDFRLSLAVSAPVAGIPYASIVNSYWSPYAKTRYIVPELPLVRLVGVYLAQKLFDLVRPLVFALHAIPLNRLRKQYGLPLLNNDLRQAYTWADYTLYADVPETVPIDSAPESHRFLGPVLWSPEIKSPEWWDRLPNDRPIVYVSLGSSGSIENLHTVIEALADIHVTVIASTAGNPQPDSHSSNIFLADYLPGDLATERANLVVCNGGSLSTYQALASGVPVIGIASNMDQMLNMLAVEQLGAGITIRAGKASLTKIRSAVPTVLYNRTYSQAAKKASRILSKHDSAQALREFLVDVFGYGHL